MTKIRSGLVAFVLLVVTVGVWSAFGEFDNEPSREDCLKHRTSEAYMLVKLSGRWGGGPATISHSVTDQETWGPHDAEPPAWSDYRRVRACDLIVLFVTPTAGAGTTTCRISTLGASPDAMSSQNRRGGPVRCTKWYAKIT